MTLNATKTESTADDSYDNYNDDDPISESMHL